MIVRDLFYIDGAWVSPSGTDTLDVIDSTTEEVFATIPAGTPADIDRAVQAASRAFPGWAATSAKDRGAFLQKMAEGLQARAGEIADVISHEVGMPRNLTEIFQVGGAQAIAALAYGTNTIARVQKIFGPGNAWVIEAKRQVMGAVAIDQLPGPSEIAVVADDTARADFIASDLLAQAEHGSGSQVLFLTASAKLLAAVENELAAQWPKLTRGKHLAEVLERGCTLVLVEDVGEAIGIVEDFAPEHLTLIIKDARQWCETIKNAGAIFIGNYSPVAAGDFIAGPSHVLPTGGAAKTFSGLTIDQFFRRTSVVEYPERALFRVKKHIEALCEVEKLDAHARSVSIRFEKENP